MAPAVQLPPEYVLQGDASEPPKVPVHVPVPSVALNVAVPVDWLRISNHPVLQPEPEATCKKLPGEALLKASVTLVHVVVAQMRSVNAVPLPWLASVPGDPTPLSNAPPFVSLPVVRTSHAVAAPKLEQKPGKVQRNRIAIVFRIVGILIEIGNQPPRRTHLQPPKAAPR